MRAIRLISYADGERADPGLIIKGTPSIERLMADRDGVLIAHDLLEHQNGPRSMGAVWDELEAMGGIWHVRGRWGSKGVRPMHDPIADIATDVSRMFYEQVENPDYGPGGLMTGSRSHPCDPIFREIIAVARRDHEGTWRPEVLDRYGKFALHRMRNGYRKAERRFFGRVDPSYSNRLYGAVREAVEKVEPDAPGQEFILRYGKAKAEIISDPI